MNRDRPITLMGILNLTGDSFYAGSRLLDPDGRLDEAALVRRAEQMLLEGAGILDIGAVSTRPGAAAVSEQEEWRRLEPALRRLRREFPEAELSVDTTRSGIVSRVNGLIGPFIVNDISAGEDDPLMLPLVARLSLCYIAMHKRGTPETMQELTGYPEGIVPAVESYFEAFSRKAEDLGIRNWILDPGFGFAKTTEQNYRLLDGMTALKRFGRPVLVGVSRKSMIYKPLGISPDEALSATQAVHLRALDAGADILRVHDVAPARDTVALWRLM